MKEKLLTQRKAMPFIITEAVLYVALVLFILLNRETKAFMYGGAVVALVAWVPLLGLKIVKPQEAYVFTLFGKYYGTLKGAGFYIVNPFCVSVNPAAMTILNQSEDVSQLVVVDPEGETVSAMSRKNKRLSLKIMTMNTSRQKINDVTGTPVEISVAVMWKIVDTAKACFNVDNYKEYLALQCGSAVRDVVRKYPYESEDSSECLKRDGEAIAGYISEELRDKVKSAGIEIVETRISYLSK